MIEAGGEYSGDNEKSTGQCTTATGVRRRKRSKPVVDKEKAIPIGLYKSQLQDTSDILGKFDLAPSTKREMYHAGYNGVGKYFAYPGRRIPSPSIAQLFYRSLNLRTELQPEPLVDEDGFLEPLDPELRLAPAVTMYLNAPEHHNYSLPKKKAESFDKLVQGMGKTKYKKLNAKRRNRGIQGRPKTVTHFELPATQTSPDSPTRNKSNAEELSISIDPVERKVENYPDGTSTSEIKEMKESPTPDPELTIHSPFSEYVLDDSFHEPQLPHTPPESTVPVKNDGGDDYFIISDIGENETYELVEYAEDIPSQVETLQSEVGDYVIAEGIGEAYENIGEEVVEEGVGQILESVELDLNLEEHYDFSQVPMQPGFEVVAQVNFGPEGDAHIQMNGEMNQQEMIYFTSTTCSSNDIAAMVVENEVGPTQSDNPLQFYVYM